MLKINRTVNKNYYCKSGIIFYVSLIKHIYIYTYITVFKSVTLQICLKIQIGNLFE